MWGTSYSGFNSLQIACERPPALKAICAIYATDDRWTDDVHWRGGALRLIDLVDYDHYMTPMVDAAAGARGVGRGLARGVAAPRRHHRAVAADVAAREPRRRLLAARLRARRRGRRLRPDRVPGDDRGGLGRRLPQQLLPHRRRAPRGGRPAPAARRPVGARRPDDRDARAADRLRRRARVVVRPLAAPRRRAGRREPARGRRRGLRARLDAPRARPRPARGLVGARQVAVAGLLDRDARARRAARPARRPRHRHVRLDRLRRPPAVGAVRRPARGRRPLARLGLGHRRRRRA